MGANTKPSKDAIRLLNPSELFCFVGILIEKGVDLKYINMFREKPEYSAAVQILKLFDPKLNLDNILKDWKENCEPALRDEIAKASSKHISHGTR